MTTINQLLFMGLFAGCFFVPGWLVLLSLNIRRHRFLLSVSLSYTLLIGILTALQAAKLSPSLFAPCIMGCSILLGAIGLIGYIGRRHRRDEQSRFWRPPAFKYRPGIFIPFAAAMSLLWVYLWWAGPYLEIPSDVWNHVQRFRDAQAQINFERFGEINAALYGSSVFQGNDWYLIVAYLMQWSGISLARVLMPLTIMTVSFFCAGIYFCSLAVFRSFRFSVRKKGWLAAGAVLFCAVTMGTSVFAYIRYYAFAPAILNYLIFLSIILIALDWFNARRWWTSAIWLIPALILIMTVIHSQEVLFACFMIMGLALVNICKGIVKGRRAIRFSRVMGFVIEDADFFCSRRTIGRRVGLIARAYRLAATILQFPYIKSLIVAAFAIAAWLGLFYWLRRKNPIVWPDAHTIMPNMPIPAISAPLIFKAFTVSPPTHPMVRLFVYELYAFYQTIGCWGLFVYLVFLINFRQMAKSNYLLAGMTMPLLTVFNPITIDLFVRLLILQAPDLPPVTIWRFNFMLPLPIVASLAFGGAVGFLCRRKGNPDAQSTGRRSNAALVKAIVIVIGLIGLIFPINNRWIDAPFSRLYTLVRNFGNDAGRWKDLTDFVARLQNPVLITDPNTAQIFGRLYPEYFYAGLQWMDAKEPETKFAETIRQQPDLGKRGLIVINRRDGVPSVTGRISRHWPEDAFLTGRFYAPEAIAFIESHPKQFKLLWTNDRIEVFRIIP